MLIKYRPEIDGLRAIAVVAVLIYHANYSIAGDQFLSGGYLGVDVFFVISGYLITLILLRELQANSYSSISFYERRARRILPALFITLIVSTFAAWYFLSPVLFKNYSGSLSSTAVFGSNYFFWNDTGYNAEASEYKPLLHTWSLAVEEQFYIVFPLVLLMIWKYSKQYLLAMLISIFLVSLLYASWINQKDANTAFYLIHARAWELMAGAMLAYLEFTRGRIQRPAFREVLPSAGFLMILVSLFYFNQNTNHPGFLTLIPVVGTMLIIRYTQPCGIFFRVIGNRLFTSIGLISYSLYLWHLPVYSFSRIRSQTEATHLDKLGWICLSVLLAVITYWFIEKPFRNRRIIPTRVIWSSSCIGVLVFLVFGAYGYYTDGIPARLPSFIGEIAEAEKKYVLPAGDAGVPCQGSGISTGKCSFLGGDDAGYTLVTVGDSHIAALHNSIHKRLPTFASFLPLTRKACLFVLGLERVSGRRRMCDSESSQQQLNKILEQVNALVIAGGRLPLQIESSRFNNQEGGVEPGSDHPVLVVPDGHIVRLANIDLVAQAFIRTTKQLLDNNVKLVLVYPIPEVGWHVPRKLTSLVREKKFHELSSLDSLTPLTTSYEVFKDRTRRSYEVYDRIPDHENLLRIYPENLLCKNDRCISHSGSLIYYRDDDHLSYEGAEMLVAHIFDAVGEKWGIVEPRKSKTN